VLNACSHRTTGLRGEGADVWFTSKPERFLGGGPKAAGLRARSTDILESGSTSGSTPYLRFRETHRSCMARDGAGHLYLEGSDQHRGGSSPSLLESSGTRAGRPIVGVLTQGFVLDEQGRKMSKSLGTPLLRK